MKHCISTLVPSVEWLATNAPTPPLARMFAEFLPMLPARCHIDGHVKTPPKEVLDSIKKGVNIRNQVAHAGNVDPSVDDVEEILVAISVDDVEEILVAISDVLWLLDYYSGHEWALAFMRPNTRSQLAAM